MQTRTWIASTILLWSACVCAQSTTPPYPSKPLRFIVPFPPGGSDTVARIMAQKLTASLGQQVIVDNRAGAGGTLGTEIAAKATPDGYTILFATASFAITAKLYRKLPYDAVSDFVPIASICSGPMLLVVNPSVAAHGTAELVQLAKARPGALNFASTGTGSITHLAAEMFAAAAGIRMTHVPYKGTGPALADLVGGQAQLMFVPLGSGLPYARSGRLRALGVASAARSSVAPDIPTVAESGVVGFDVSTWYGVLAPARTPGGVVTRLNADIEAALAATETRRQLMKLGFDPMPGTPAQFRALIAADLRKWGTVIQSIGVTLD